MNGPELWIKTEDQVARFFEARDRGRMCASCGRPLHAGESVYVERFGVGEVQTSRFRPARPRSYAYGPVGVECASAGLVRYADGHAPSTCAVCGRGVIDQRPPRMKTPTCSRRCPASRTVRQWTRNDGEQPDFAGPSPDGGETWGARLTRLREARGMSRADVVAGMNRLGRRTRVDDLGRWETKGIVPRLATFAALARVLRVPMDVLAYGEREARRIAAAWESIDA